MRTLAICGALLCLFLGSAGRAQATTCDTVLSFPLDTVIHNNPGKMIGLGSIDTSAYAGGTGTATTQNQESVHPGNHLHIDTGVDTATLLDVEVSPAPYEVAAGPFTLGDTLSVTLELGSDGIFSAGGDIEICVEDETPPTTTPETTPETTVPDTTPPTTVPETTVPPTDPPTTTTPPTYPPATDPPATDPPTTTVEETAPPTTDEKELVPPESEEEPPPTSEGTPPSSETPPSSVPANQTLPETGASETGIIAAAAAAMLAGFLVLLLVRRRA